MNLIYVLHKPCTYKNINADEVVTHIAQRKLHFTECPSSIDKKKLPLKTPIFLPKNDQSMVNIPQSEADREKCLVSAILL